VQNLGSLVQGKMQAGAVLEWGAAEGIRTYEGTSEIKMGHLA